MVGWWIYVYIDYFYDTQLPHVIVNKTQLDISGNMKKLKTYKWLTE
jgi:hypothetical protein